MKTTIKSGKIGYALLTGVALMAVTALIAAEAPPTGGWSIASLTGSGKAVTVTSSGSAVTVEFDAQSTPPTAKSSELLVGGSDPSNVFYGNLAGFGYSGIQFQITGSGSQPGEASVLLRIIEQTAPLVYHEWIYSDIAVSTKAGEWTITKIPLKRLDGWTRVPARDFTAGEARDFTAAELDAFWAADTADVSAMLVRIQPGGSAAQSYSVSDFCLMGAGIITKPASLTSLEHYFGVNSLEGLSPERLAELMALDTDKDGMSDYHEILAGFDPGNPSSSFVVRVAVGAGSNAISWDGVLGKKYAILRSNDLRGRFQPILTEILCVATGAMTRNDDNPVAGAANFYKVVNY